MRCLVALVALLSLAPSAMASAGPMDEKDLAELATLIAHGEVTEVVCLAAPEFDGTKTYTPYWATLTIDEVQKGEDLASVTLPFGTLDYAPGAALPKCDWAPYYEAGFKGLFYLTSGADSDLYTLVGEGAYVPDADSVGEGLPSCEAVGADAADSGDVSVSIEDTSEIGPEPDGGNEFNPDTGGEGVPEWDVGTGVPLDESTCEEMGGSWDECASSSCPTCDDCIAECVCPPGKVFDPVDGCMGQPSFEALCNATGGTSECVPPDCPPDAPCAAMCVMVCDCPVGLVWDEQVGCTPPPPMTELCPETGGQMGCLPPDCPDDEPDCDAIEICIDMCECPEGQAYDTSSGCVDAPTQEPGEGSGSDGSSSGCAGGGSSAPVTLVVCALALSRRRRGVCVATPRTRSAA
ncbi:MAG: hypothetical protein QF464_01445 [Myxococcota bacterium]|jgi:hypothetical protein|nr:hypothetical protein [Myxococcota bacterium]